MNMCNSHFKFEFSFCIQHDIARQGTMVDKTNFPLTNRKIFSCAECGKQFSSNGNLKRHVEVHTGKFSYYCKICRRGFNNDSNFKSHMRAHEGLKYNCEYCTKSFVSKEKYKYHLSVHTGQYRFKCTTCGKGFNIKSSFGKHQLTHM